MSLVMVWLCRKCPNEARYTSGLCGVCDVLTGAPTTRLSDEPEVLPLGPWLMAWASIGIAYAEDSGCVILDMSLRGTGVGELPWVEVKLMGPWK